MEGTCDRGDERYKRTGTKQLRTCVYKPHYTPGMYCILLQSTRMYHERITEVAMTTHNKILVPP